MLPGEDNRFHFTRSERKGLIILIVILAGLLLCWRIIPYWIQPPPPDKQLLTAWKSFRNHKMVADTPEGRYQANTYITRKHASQKVRLAPFDPNLASQQELLALGLPPRTVTTLLHYREKGGHFYKKEDLKKLYTLSESDYLKIAPFVHISSRAPDEQTKRTRQEPPIKSDFRQPIELNKADIQTLVALPGIGPTFAKRIIAYRKRLGGFVSVGQLREVYGLPDSTYQKLKNKFKVDMSLVKKIPVNTASEAQLSHHPYISSSMAKNIIRLRNDLSKFKNIRQLKQIPLINAEKYRKIAPYLTLQ